MRAVATTALGALLIGGLMLTAVPEASAHPAPFAHRHTFRPAPQPVAGARHPRKGLERRGRLVTRWYMGLTGRLTGLVPTGATPRVIDRYGGGGARLYFGVRFTPALSLEFGTHGDFFGDDAMIGAATLDLRWVLTHPAARVLPYVSIGVGGYGVNAPLDHSPWEAQSDTGIGGQLAGGVKFRFGRMHIVVGAHLHIVHMEQADATMGGLSANAGVEIDL